MQEQPGRAGSVVVLAVAFLLSACSSVGNGPEPRLSLEVPPPPGIEPGAIEVHAPGLTPERQRALREGIEKAERGILSAYGDFLEKHRSHERGRLQLRIGISGTGTVVETKAVYSELDADLVERVREILADIDFGAGPEAWVFYSIELEPDPLQVLALRPDFGDDAPALLARVENRASFPVPSGRARVTVLFPDGGEPRRLAPMELDETFDARSRRTLRIPVPREQATTRNTFLLDVEPRFR